MTTILNVFSVLGGLAMFLYGMALMSEGLQKSAGDRLRAFMASMTSNAFKRVLTGTAVTALVQSSSATTIMVVSFVNAGLLTLGNAIGVIMGANIGTTLTAWITSLGFCQHRTVCCACNGLRFRDAFFKEGNSKEYGTVPYGIRHYVCGSYIHEGLF